jgi:hypothetical protein
MYKKFFIILIVFSPLIYTIFFGYPIISGQEFVARQKTMPGAAVSKRCFEVGDDRPFINCYVGHKERIRGVKLFKEVNGRINKINPIFSLVLISSLGIFIIAAIIVLV